MRFVACCADGKKLLYKDMDADCASDALFFLRCKYPELNIYKDDLFINVDELKDWFEEKGILL